MEQTKQEKEWKNLQFFSKESAGIQSSRKSHIVKHLHICGHFDNYICNSYSIGLAVLCLRMYIFTFAHLSSFVLVPLTSNM